MCILQEFDHNFAKSGPLELRFCRVAAVRKVEGGEGATGGADDKPAALDAAPDAAPEEDEGAKAAEAEAERSLLFSQLRSQLRSQLHGKLLR